MWMIVTRLRLSQRRFIVFYADDILIYAPALAVNICEQELLSIDMAINVKKTCTIRIGPCYHIKCCYITITNQTLPWVSELRYLCFYVVRSCKLKTLLDHAKRSFHRSLMIKLHIW